MTGMRAALVSRLEDFEPGLWTGRVTRVSMSTLQADGPDAPVGALCAIDHPEGEVLASLVSIEHSHVVLAPYEPVTALRLGARVRLIAPSVSTLCGDAFLGRAVDGLGRPIDGGGPIGGTRYSPSVVGPLERVTPNTQVITGFRAIDGLLPIAKGQRIGVLAPPGVGKTTLLSQLACRLSADRCVICLVGERGREVEALWTKDLDDAARARTVMVAATSDETAAVRIQAVEQALALAAQWRAEGLHVLFLLDSATRYAMALREIGLAAGEPPTLRAYTPGVFAALPRVVERCGALKTGGAITAVMTVLSETDDVDDPITEVMKSLLDGHIVLSRRIAEQGRYPAVDIARSISRLADQVMTPDHRALVGRAVASIGAYEASRTLIEAGVYTAGSNAETDAALMQRPGLEAFLTQGAEGVSDLPTTLKKLSRALEVSR